MANVSYPGVYVDEVSSGVHPIAVASTSTAAFLGQAEKGSLTDAIKVFSFTQFQNLYGGFIPGVYLAQSVFQFFNNGGAQCYIVRVSGANTGHCEHRVERSGRRSSSEPHRLGGQPGRLGQPARGSRQRRYEQPRANEFDLAVHSEGNPIPLERFRNLSMIPDAPNFVGTATSSSNYIRVTVSQGNTNAAAGRAGARQRRPCRSGQD